MQKRDTVYEKPPIDHLDCITGCAHTSFDVFHSVRVPTEKDDYFAALRIPEYREANIGAV